jgi:hypothetical protein
MEFFLFFWSLSPINDLFWTHDCFCLILFTKTILGANITMVWVVHRYMYGKLLKQV